MSGNSAQKGFALLGFLCCQHKQGSGVGFDTNLLRFAFRHIWMVGQSCSTILSTPLQSGFTFKCATFRYMGGQTTFAWFRSCRDSSIGFVENPQVGHNVSMCSSLIIHDFAIDE